MNSSYEADAVGAPSDRGLLLGALALVLLVQGPLLFGRGVDLPDDMLEFAVSAWEWWRHTLLSGENPFWVTGKLGGIPLYSDVVAMGPFYPGIWLGLILPVHVALPLCIVLHAVLLLLGGRFLARSVGASRPTATLAGAALAVGPLGAFAVVDGRTSAWPAMVWLPFLLGCIERSVGDRGRLWAALAGASLALGLLGGHLRVSAVFGALAVLALLIRRVPLRRSALTLGLGLAGGAPGFVPMLLEWRRSSARGDRLEFLSGLAETDFTLENVPGLLVPRATVFETDYGIGAVLLLGLVALLALRDAKRPRWLVALAAVCLGAALSTELPGLRWVFAPLLVLSHPVNDPWSALAMIPLAAAGAVGLDRWVARPTRAPVVVGGVLLVASGALLALGGDAEGLAEPSSRISLAIGLVAAGATVGLATVAAGRRSVWLLAALGLLDLGGVAARIHLVAPSEPVRLAARRDVGAEPLAAGYVDLVELARFEPFAYARPEDPEGAPGDEPVESWQDVVERVSEDLAHRPLPPHIGMGLGVRSMSGKAKMAPVRTSRLLVPVVEALEADPEKAVAPGGVALTAASRFGVGVALGPDGRRWTVPDPTPPCRLADEVRVVPDPEARARMLLESPAGPTLLEAPLPGSPGPGVVRCDADSAEVEASQPTLLVLRRQIHPGWHYTSDVPLKPVPADEIDTALWLPAGRHRVTWRFVPPGLPASLVLFAFGWAGVGALVFASSREPQVR